MNRTRTTGAALVSTILVAPAFSAPTVQNVQGRFDHKSTVTISGLDFGTKPQAAPVVWDDASGNDINAKWDDLWPSVAAGAPADSAPHYTAPQRGVSLPHNNITRYIAGAHAGGGPRTGAAVFLNKIRGVTSYPYYYYASWYQRYDNGWTFCEDDNNKFWATAPSSLSPYVDEYWYAQYSAGTLNSLSARPQVDVYILPANNGVLWGSGSVRNPMTEWSKIEIEVKYSDQNDGYVRLWVDGSQQVSSNERTGFGSLGQRIEGIGGYARCYNQPNNWRYFADVYVDYTPARVVLANNANLSLATIVEPQIPTSWSNTSIQLSANLGRFTSGQTAYLFVVNASGQRNAAGLPVTIGAAQTTPNPPAGLSAQ